MSETLTIGNDDACAKIATLGAELVAWRVAKRQLLWQADPQIWGRTSPLLFPVVGQLHNSQIMVDGKTYPMDIHGFASSSRFVVGKKTENKATLILDHSSRTMAQYPFPFRLSVEYTIKDQSLSVSLQVENTGKSDMPYALGLHPGFCWPLESHTAEADNNCRDAYLEFQFEEAPDVPDISESGLFLETTHKVPLNGRRLDLSDRLLENNALCFLNARSQSVRYVSCEGSAIEVNASNFPHFAIWSRPPAKFLCIESWTGHGDPESYDGELSQKPSMRILAPGCEATHNVDYEYREKI